jgi:hypothetical protein
MSRSTSRRGRTITYKFVFELLMSMISTKTTAGKTLIKQVIKKFPRLRGREGSRRRALQVHEGEGDRPDKDADQAVEKGHQESGAVGERQSKNTGNQADRLGYVVDNHS